MLLRVCSNKVCLHSLLGLSSSLFGFFVLQHPLLLLKCSLKSICKLDIPKAYDGQLNLADREIVMSLGFLFIFSVTLILCFELLVVQKIIFLLSLSKPELLVVKFFFFCPISMPAYFLGSCDQLIFFCPFRSLDFWLLR